MSFLRYFLAIFFVTKRNYLIINKLEKYYHLICHIQKALQIENEEELAYLCGDLNMRSYKLIESLNRESRF